MDDPNVSFSTDLLNKLQEIAFLKIIEVTSTEEQATINAQQAHNIKVIVAIKSFFIIFTPL